MAAYACYGFIVVGHWPYYAHPDPKELPARVLLQVTAIIMLVGALSLVAIPVGYAGWRTVMHLRRRPIPKHGTAILFYVAGAALWLVDFAALHGRVPWHSIISWILD
jgi:hypothetical protein